MADPTVSARAREFVEAILKRLYIVNGHSLIEEQVQQALDAERTDERRKIVEAMRAWGEERAAGARAAQATLRADPAAVAHALADKIERGEL